jgi:outer membrane autotransporter protein
MQGFHGTLYWAFDDGVWNTGIYAGYSHYDVDGQRTTGLPSSPMASARYDMQQYRIGGVVRRVVTLADNWWLLPEARMSWEPLSHDGFAETGGGDANFNSQAADWDIARAGAAVTLRHRLDAQPDWMAEVGLGWQSLLGDTAMPLKGRYQGAKATLYETPGDAYLRDSMTVRGSLTYRHSDQVGFGLDYAGQFNAQSSHNQIGIMARVLF